MNLGRTVFAQLMQWFPLAEFRKCVERYRGNHRVRHLSCLDQFYSMAFAQLTFRESLRDIEACLRSTPSKLYHLGIRGSVCRNTLAVANAKRDCRIYADLAQFLMRRARELYAADEYGLNLSRAVYAFDSSVIELSLKLFPWARFKPHCSGVKLHALLNVETHIPTFACITRAKVHDVKLLDALPIEAGAVYVLDRGYIDYGRLHRIAQNGAFFVTRPRKSFRFKRTCSRPVDQSAGLRSDHTVRLVSFYPAHSYPDSLRRIRYVDTARNKRLTFITNNFTWAAITIAELYKSRWQVELFFKWIKQHLRIKAFFGTSENAVKTQIWIALSVYLIMAIIKKELNLPHSLHTLSQVFSLNLFEKTPLQQLLAQTTCTEMETEQHNPLLLFDF